MISIRRLLALVAVAGCLALAGAAGSDEIQDEAAGAAITVSGDAGTEVFVLAKQEDGTFATTTSAVLVEGGEATFSAPAPTSPADGALLVLVVAPDGSIIWATQDQKWYLE